MHLSAVIIPVVVLSLLIPSFPFHFLKRVIYLANTIFQRTVVLLLVKRTPLAGLKNRKKYNIKINISN
jgi:hypothetical protein